MTSAKKDLLGRIGILVFLLLLIGGMTIFYIINLVNSKESRIEYTEDQIEEIVKNSLSKEYVGETIVYNFKESDYIDGLIPTVHEYAHYNYYLVCIVSETYNDTYEVCIGYDYYNSGESPSIIYRLKGERQYK